MKKMNDKTVVRVRVPKHLYEAIQDKLALKENEMPVEESMQDIVQYLSDPEVLKTLGVVATALGITGGAKALADKIKNSGTDISGITGAQHGMDENKEMQAEASGVEYAWIPAAAAGLGIAASMLKSIVSHMKQNNLKGMSGFMQAYKAVGSQTASGIERSKGV